MLITLPQVAILRTAADVVYHQGPSSKCTAYGTKNAIECMYDRSTSHNGLRPTADYIYARGKFWGNQTGNSGLSLSWIAKGLENDGVSYTWDENIPGVYEQPDNSYIVEARTNGKFKMVPIPMYTEDLIQNIKISLCFGFPVVVSMFVNPNFNSFTTNDWRTMDWDASVPATLEHAVCIVGYDDTVGRFLVENSWGTWSGDGGYFGMKYDKLLPGPQLCVQTWHRLEVTPVKPVKVVGFSAIGLPLTIAEAGEFYQRYKPHLAGYLNTLSGQTLVNECIRLGVSDKMLEVLKGWARGSMPQQLPGVDFTGMHYDSPTGYWFITSAECLGFVQRNKPSAHQTLADILTNQSVVALMQTAKTLGYSEKHVEYLADWERGFVRETAPVYGIPESDIIFDLL